MSRAFRDRVAAVCRPLPGAARSDPWGGGHEVWKVGGKIFACIYPAPVDPGVSVKTPDIETASMLIDAGVGRRARYFHRSWVRLPEEVDASELRHRLVRSYDIVRASLGRKVRAGLDDREDR